MENRLCGNALPQKPPLLRRLPLTSPVPKLGCNRHFGSCQAARMSRLGCHRINCGLHCQNLMFLTHSQAKGIPLALYFCCTSREVQNMESQSATAFPSSNLVDKDPKPCHSSCFIPAITPSSNCPASGGGPSSNCSSSTLPLARGLGDLFFAASIPTSHDSPLHPINNGLQDKARWPAGGT